MEKNVRVLDENGEEYGSTWPRRARGLVKNGRARFIDENTICLAAPPNCDLEAQNMNEQSGVEFTIPFIIRQIAAIQADTAYLIETIDKLAAMGNGDSGETGSPGNLMGEAKAKALGDVVRCRETTNQMLLRLYERMYDDLAGKNK